MPKAAINRDAVSGEALFILRNLRENGRLGRSNKLADVKAALEPSVSLEFDNYFFFLRKFHYIAMDREAQLKLTDQGERVAGGELGDKFSTEVGEFFAEQLASAEDEPPVAQGTEEPMQLPPPPPELLLDEAEVVPTGATQIAPPPSPPSMAPMRAARSAMPALELTPPPGAAQVPSSVGSPSPVALITPAVPEPRRETSIGPAPVAPAPLPFAPPASSVSSMPPPAATPVAAAPVASKGTELDLRYQKFDPIGTGPLGTVFKGRFTALGLDICLKELKDIFGYFSFLQRGEVLKRLKKELCAQAQVRHPGIVQVVDQNVDASRPYFVLELMNGSLKERLEAGGGSGVPVPFALRTFLQMAYGLRAAHATGLTHHNLKPENVLFDAYGNAKLADFGLGRVVEVDSTKGMPQVFVGTGGMPYMAPELMNRGAKEPGPSADVYGLGILLYEMLTGQIPGRRSPLPSEVNPEAPSGLDQLFDKATQDKREQRYPDVDAMLEDFYKAFPDKEFLVRGDLVLSSDAPQP
ncbi:serine/threonine protein kinase [Myxococcus sp. CA051A]|uniref:serine/threonine-protein kinase n=1 Tax=unclassified Myxococcus TaxID=2648731 RepID=UPI00157BA958|nr:MULTISPECIES: serine/threonine-protein kinase [unclassified Myxococcus]NTX09312.1 serine/threonine protein kinase [Myxococcus sp. CA056]NTX51312.1 serine/threonine protein kinase [Myxococcus sp. CA039A]NTX61270.1 serine/threonine protein kinase [Myxococcus sp. CA051A]